MGSDLNNKQTITPTDADYFVNFLFKLEVQRHDWERIFTRRFELEYYGFHIVFVSWVCDSPHKF